MLGLAIAATLLACDAWFDVCLSLNTPEQRWTLAVAILVELPVATLLATSAARILQRTSAITQVLRGLEGTPTPLWKQPFVMLPPGEA